ncbi:MAG TPA: peptidoglycan editing factor PgeF [Thermodesulfobacteriota bacterium]|nr:peptidoglycan editing factor PgeF [Thermodesulfobacteriota bacterium]
MNILGRSASKTENNLSYFQSQDIAKLGWIQHAFLTRQGGVSPPPYDSLNLSDKNGDHKECVSTNKNLIARTFGFDPSRLVLLDQMQQDEILLLKKPIATFPSPLGYDALVTNFTNLYLAILTADCLPIFVVDQKRKVTAAIHAGRNGTALHITTKVLTKMKEEFGCSSSDLLITLGPSIGACCYEIDEKAFHPEWEPFSTSKGTGKWMLDLAQINIAQMNRGGIEDAQISRINLCTHCCGDLFFSYRREGRTGRQLSFIGMI